jgi:hypothetical protein
VGNSAGKHSGHAFPNFAKALLKEVQNVVRTVAFFAALRTAVAAGDFVILLRPPG